MHLRGQCAQECTINLGDWELVGYMLRPTHKHLQEYASNLAVSTHDEVWFFELPDGGPGTAEEPRTIQASRLVAASAPLRALATGPFSEAHSRRVPFQESAEDFRIIRRFVYCQPIDMRQVPLKFAFVADRWELSPLFQACFELAPQTSLRAHDQSIQAFVNQCFPLLASLQVPQKFCNFFAFRLALSLDSLGDGLERQLFPWLVPETGNKKPDVKRRKVEPVSTGKNPNPEVVHSTGDRRPPVEGSAGVQLMDRQKDTAVSAMEITVNLPKHRVDSCSNNISDVACGKLWPILIGKDILRFVVHYSERFTHQLHCEDLMELVMNRLESFLSDRDLERVLRQFEWESLPCAQALASKRSKKWSLRGWRTLALMDHKRRRPYGEECRIIWVCKNAGKLLRSSCVKTSWEGSARFNGHEVVLGLHCHGMSSGQKGMFLSISFADCEMCYSSGCEEEDCGGHCAEGCSTEFWARVNVVENGCGCNLGRFGELQGRVVEDRGFDLSKRYEVPAGGEDEVRIQIMSGDGMKLWRMRHTGDCGLVIGIRLWGVSWSMTMA